MVFACYYSIVKTLGSPQKQVNKELGSLGGEEPGWYGNIDVTVVITTELQ